MNPKREYDGRLTRRLRAAKEQKPQTTKGTKT